jgi:hypothetical protein
MTAPERRLRLFLDTGVIVAGCLQRWGAAKMVLMLCTHRPQYTVVLAADVERELRGILARQSATLGTAGAQALEAVMAGWLARVRLERWPGPTVQEVEQLLPRVLPVLRHINDLRAVVTAIQAQPDWVISSNRAHWNAESGRRVGLRIISPQAFVQRLAPPR